jgi:hypothetical protein
LPDLPITIVTPAYNAGAFLRETIDSILAQGYPALEHIVIDDGSTDDTPAVLASYGSRIRALRQPNAGEQAAVNAGVALAKSDIVAVVNADDPVRPGLLAAVAQAFHARPELVGVYPDWILIDERGQERFRYRTLEYDFSDMLERHYAFPGPGGFFRKSALQGEPVRDTTVRYSGDFGFWLRLGLRGPMQRVPGFYATWRQHGGGTTAGHSEALARDKIKLAETILARPDLPAELRARRAQILSAAYYRASLHALHNPALPGRSFLLQSYLLKPVWPGHPNPAMRRSLLRVLFILGQPVSTWIYQAALRVGAARPIPTGAEAAR